MLMFNQKEYKKKFADYYNLRNPPLLKNTRYIIKLESFGINFSSVNVNIKMFKKWKIKNISV